MATLRKPKERKGIHQYGRQEYVHQSEDLITLEKLRKKDESVNRIISECHKLTQA